MKNYKSLQSFKYFTSGWVLEVVWKKYLEENVVLILGKVRHSYAANKAPLRPWVVVGSNGTVLVAHCTCMAGLAETCSHVGAVLHWMETAVRIRDDMTCTSKENKWLMPRPVKDIPYLELRDIDFTTPKRQRTVLACTTNTSVNTPTSSRVKIVSPSHDEKQDFFKRIAQEREKKPLILSMIQPYSSNFVLASDHLPKLLHSLYKPAYLDSNYCELLKLADNHAHDEVTPAMVDRLAQLTSKQSMSKEWFKYRAGRITASKFRQVLHTDCQQPSLSLLKSICYPETHRFSTKATTWGCQHEKDALTAYKTEMSASHADLNVTLCGFFISTEHPFLGASPDALTECNCCGQGVVEVKCPLSAQESSFAEAARNNTNFCLQQCGEGKYALKHQHQYYYQCQLQIFVTGRSFCDFVVWTQKELHTERLTLDEDLIISALPVAKKFFRMCILPELLGKWYTRHRPTTGNTDLESQECEEDDGSWCSCKERKGGDMVGCDNRSCVTKWFHLECVGLSAVPRGKWHCTTCQQQRNRKRKANSMQ